MINPYLILAPSGTWNWLTFLYGHSRTYCVASLHAGPYVFHITCTFDCNMCAFGTIEIKSIVIIIK